MFENMNELIEDYTKQKAILQEKLQNMFNRECMQMFEKFPELETVQWTQYTPRWNDGEECVFGINDPYFTNCKDEDMIGSLHYGELDGYDEDESETKYWVVGSCPQTGEFPKGIDKLAKDFEKIIKSDTIEEILKSAFGNHVKVTITKEGIDIVEYEHD